MCELLSEEEDLKFLKNAVKLNQKKCISSYEDKLIALGSVAQAPFNCFVSSRDMFAHT